MPDEELFPPHGIQQQYTLSYAKSNIPIVGALIDYIETSFDYVRRRTLTNAEKLHAKTSKLSLSSTFMASLCFILGVMCNVKFEIIRFDDAPLSNDLHFMLMSSEDKIYIDDIDSSQVLWCLEFTDFIVNLISCLLIWTSDRARSPLSEYLFVPWLGVVLRGLFTRQVPTVTALIYTMAVVTGTTNPLFLTTFTFLFLIEARLWLEVARLVRSRWERRIMVDEREQSDLPSLFTDHNATESVEVRNFVY